MDLKKLHLIYFSATNTTIKVIKTISEEMAFPDLMHHNITQGVSKPIHLNSSDVVIFGMPVYGGRIPRTAVESLMKIKGDGTPTIIVCVYGNRHYDDALLELKDIVTDNGFIVFAAGAFIAQHSIFSGMGQGRPDQSDLQSMRRFGADALGVLSFSRNFSRGIELEVKGNNPYKEFRVIPLYPSGNNRCDECGTCVNNCPVGAIAIDNPRKTDESVCISCGRCIYVCPQRARRFSGLKYMLARRRFTKKYSKRREPEYFFAM